MWFPCRLVTGKEPSTPGLAGDLHCPLPDKAEMRGDLQHQWTETVVKGQLTGRTETWLAQRGRGREGRTHLPGGRRGSDGADDLVTSEALAREFQTDQLGFHPWGWSRRQLGRVLGSGAVSWAQPKWLPVGPVWQWVLLGEELPGVHGESPGRMRDWAADSGRGEGEGPCPHGMGSTGSGEPAPG